MASKLSSKILVIIGSTATGKTELSIKLAKKFQGEIINADSMQIYSGLDLLTNKPNSEELSSCPHHLFSLLQPSDSCHAYRYQQLTLPLIDQIHERGNFPILVGGTLHYIECVLFKYILCKQENSYLTIPLPEPYKSLAEIENEDAKTLFSLLQRIDPESANKVHPNNTRKVFRPLEVYFTTGYKLSEHYEMLQEKYGISKMMLRFENPCIIWLDCEKSVLCERISKRIDTMIERGLIDEVQNFYLNEYLKKSQYIGKGLLQSIGFKECLYFLDDWHNNGVLNDDMVAHSLEKLKQATRAYSRYQCNWIKNKFLAPQSNGQTQFPNIYRIDTSEPTLMDTAVIDDAALIVTSYLEDNKPASIQPLAPISREPRGNLHSQNYCNSCQKFVFSDNSWKYHLKSAHHKAKLKSLTKLEKLFNLAKTKKTKDVKNESIVNNQSSDTIEDDEISLSDCCLNFNTSLY